jgi:hypothetical protein
VWNRSDETNVLIEVHTPITYVPDVSFAVPLFCRPVESFLASRPRSIRSGPAGRRACGQCGAVWARSHPPGRLLVASPAAPGDGGLGSQGGFGWRTGRCRLGARPMARTASLCGRDGALLVWRWC